MSFFAELKRRNVIRVALAYLAGAWLLIQITETIFPLFGLEAAARLFVIMLVIGFPGALAFAWVFELTPEGLKRQEEVDRSVSITQKTGKILDRVIVVALGLAVCYFAFDKFVLDPVRDARREESVAKRARSEALIESYDKSIAVLPFANMSADPEQEYFSDGISEELLNLLARIPELRVISRSSSFAFKGKDIDTPAVAEQLNVSHVLEGSVRKAGDRVRISAQLIEARSDTHLWSEVYERTLGDIFAMQSEIAANVAEQLKVTLLRNQALQPREVDPEAYALFLRALHLRRENTPEAYEQAVELYQQSLAIDPGYPPAWEGLAEAYVYQALAGLRAVHEAYRLAREAINKSLAIDPQFGVGVAGLGWIAILYDHDIAAAARHFERAMALDPTNLDVIQGVAYLAESIGRLDTASAFKEYAVARDPLGPVGHRDLATTYLKAGRYDDGLASARLGLTLRPDQIAGHYLIGMALLLKGDAPAALEAMEQETFEEYRLMGLAVAHHDLGQRDESDKHLRELTEKYAGTAPSSVAAVYAWRGETDQAFGWLERMLELNDQSLWVVATHYLYKNLHDDPRWQPFLAKIGKSDAQLAQIEFQVALPEG